MLPAFPGRPEMDYHKCNVFFKDIFLSSLDKRSFWWHFCVVSLYFVEFSVGLRALYRIELDLFSL